MPSLPAVSLLFSINVGAKGAETVSFAIQHCRGLSSKKKTPHTLVSPTDIHLNLYKKVLIWGVGGKADAGGGWSHKKRSVLGELQRC